MIFKTVIEKGRDYDQVIKLWIGPKLLVFLVDPRDVELLLSSHVYIDKSPEYRFFKPWLGNGLLISTGKFIKFNLNTIVLKMWILINSKILKFILFLYLLLVHRSKMENTSQINCTNIPFERVEKLYWSLQWKFSSGCEKDGQRKWKNIWLSWLHEWMYRRNSAWYVKYLYIYNIYL